MDNKKIWIISDSHFNHKSIIEKFEFRPVDFGDKIIRKIKNNVKETDTLIHIGDVIFDRQSELNGILESMGKCTKILVRGNHDKSGVNFYLNKGFNLVVDKIEIKDYMGYNIVITHIPIIESELKEGRINIHGHLHTNSHHISEYSTKPENYILYSAEKENYMPVTINELIRRKKT